MATMLRRVSLSLVLVLFLGACATGSKITKLQAEAEPVDAPYNNVLVVSLFKTVDVRKRFERALVGQLEARGVKATAMTALVSASDDVNRDAVIKQVERTGADAVIVTRLVSVEPSVKEKKESPFASYKFHSTGYAGVYEVDQTEYSKLGMMEIVYDLATRTDLYSTSSQKMVWSIGAERKVEHNVDDPWDHDVVANEAKAIVSQLTTGRLIK